MNASLPDAPGIALPAPAQHIEPAPDEVMEQLGSLLRSSHFRHSKRYPSLLQYIVAETLAGRADALKERTLGMSVFDREADYDTNADPVVRVSAGEVRKRIAQYYQLPGHELELRIEIPLGSYVPRFFWPAEHSAHVTTAAAAEAVHKVALVSEGHEPPPPLHVATHVEVVAAAGTTSPTELKRLGLRARAGRLHLQTMYVLLALSLAVLGVLAWRATYGSRMSPGAARVWGDILDAPAPTLIVLGVHSFDDKGNDISAISHRSMPQTGQTLLTAMTHSDMVHLSDVTSYGALAGLLTGHTHSFRTQGAADTTLEQLQQGPFILVGGFNNFWTTHLTQPLRFRLVTLNGRDNVIQDSRHPETIWTLDVARSALSDSRDYGLVSCFVDPETEQYVVLAGGIGKSGTEAATDFLANEKNLDAWMRSLPPQSGRNMQVVVSTDVIEGKHGPPHAVAYHFW